jgi:broad specificity phosphatase PhoE
MSASTRLVTRLTLLCHGTTAATRAARFPDDEPLEPSAVAQVRGLASSLGRYDAVWSGPARCALETAFALGLTAAVCGALDDVRPGAWRGLSIAEIERTDPEALATWLRDPAAPPPGGESLLDVMARIEPWLRERSGEGRRILAVTHAVVIRAALVHSLMAPPAAAWRIDVSPLSRTVLHAHDGRWTVCAVNWTPRIRS